MSPGDMIFRREKPDFFKKISIITFLVFPRHPTLVLPALHPGSGREDEVKGIRADVNQTVS